MPADWLSLEKKLRKALNENRYQHTLGVTYTSCLLASVHGADVNQARLAGLLHDCAKCIPNEEKITLCKKHRVDVTDFELAHPVLLHAKLGAFVAAKTYDVTDEAVLDAIRWHTTGRPAMTLLEKIVFTADYIEPNRDKAPRLDEIRKAAFRDLDSAVLMILEDTVAYLNKNPKSMDTQTISAYEYYRDNVKTAE